MAFDFDPSDLLVRDQVAIVTGGGAGIGQGVARGLARCGARVAILEIDRDRCTETEKLLREDGRECLAIPTDVMRTEEVRAAVARAAERFGRLDILVNNAGGVRGRRFLDQSEASWRRHIDMNLVSMLAATAAAAPVMIAGGRGGAIVNVASSEAFRAAPMFAVYAACKAGMVSFTRTMALELGEHGIRVNAIAPDHTDTPGLRGIRSGQVDPVGNSWPTPELREALARYVPLGRGGVVEECAAAVVFLCSRMARYVTGTTLSVDGGTVAASGWIRSGNGWTLMGSGNG